MTAAAESADAMPAGGTYAVLRMDRSGVPTFCATLDEARELAAERVAQHGGGCWVFRLVGTTTAVAAWLPEPPDIPSMDGGQDNPCGEIPEDLRRRPSDTDAWRVYP
ncbi:MAG TPA: hypothetical protein DCZ11_05280 [Gammaproteobacteria bacterium]|nr:hypothetical protein [Gammaproteobacteria bacterium]MCH77835.1 hypothetical protein [Gammaproteobacteria bacterium]